MLSEIRKGPRRAQAEVYQWWQGMKDQELFLSVMTLGEIRQGIDRLGSRDVSQSLALERWGRLQTIRSLPEVDALPAASAMEHDLTLVTRNEADFAGLGVRVLKPFLRSPAP